MNPKDIADLFQDLGPVRCRPMFGGLGLYCDERMFAIAVAGEIYLKSDPDNRRAFEEAGSRPFVYERAGREVAMGFWRLPDEALDDPAAAAHWGRLGLDAAARAARGAARKGGRRRVARTDQGEGH